MDISFTLHYKTAWGESLHAVLFRQGAEPSQRHVHVTLESTDGENWHGHTQLSIQQPLPLQYYYEVRRGADLVRREWKIPARCCWLNPQANRYVLVDQWQDVPSESWLYTSCMTDVFAPRELHPVPPATPSSVVLYVQTPRTHAPNELGVCGNVLALGSWQPSAAPALIQTRPNTWAVALNAADLQVPLEYKFFLRDKHTGHITWEEGPNRILLRLPSENCTHVYHNLRPQFPPTAPFRAAGVVLPVFSLRSKNSAGAGDFGDLKTLIDWAAKTGQKVVQLLPIHDTTITATWTDSYPYNAISVYALHPLYTDVRHLPVPLTRQQENERQRLNAQPVVDYEQTLAFKLLCLKNAFEQDAEHTLGTPQFHHFFHQNAHWLPAYAMFCVLRDLYHTANFHTWPKHARFSDDDLHRFCAPGTPHIHELHFWYYVQFVLHTQLAAAATHARQRGVILKGDLPIGISPFSVEAWTEPDLFHLNVQAGAPPDDFSATGQNWGFPTYNWPAMARDNYRWWRRRLQHMAQYFDAYRVDHVLGFFRIWEIPSSCVDGLLGQFSPALPLSHEEIESYGLPFHTSFLRPHITEKTLEKHFGKQAKQIKENFLSPASDGHFQLQEAFNTQRKIADFFAKNTDENAQALSHGLQALCTEVLFVEDARQPHRYHPRITAQTSDAFDALNEQDRQAFTRLYNDFFFHRHNDFWQENALQKLPALLQSTRMLCCAEDLGMVPHCVPPVLNRLQILSLEIQRMPKKPGTSFADIFNYPYLSVATPSTHDMSVLRAWWTENRATSQQFWHEVLGHAGEAPVEMSGKICEEILNLHLKSNSMLALIGWQDWLGMDEKLRAANPEEERINVPANPRHYWRYRMHLTLEELLNADGFNEKIKEMIKSAGR